MATLIIRSVQNNPVRLKLELNSVTYLIEYPDRDAALEDLRGAPSDADLQTVLRLVLREWKKTDTNLNNLLALVGKTCTITFNVSIA